MGGRSPICTYGSTEEDEPRGGDRTHELTADGGRDWNTKAALTACHLWVLMHCEVMGPFESWWKQNHLACTQPCLYDFRASGTQSKNSSLQKSPKLWTVDIFKWKKWQFMLSPFNGNAAVFYNPQTHLGEKEKKNVCHHNLATVFLCLMCWHLISLCTYSSTFGFLNLTHIASSNCNSASQSVFNWKCFSIMLL